MKRLLLALLCAAPLVSGPAVEPQAAPAAETPAPAAVFCTSMGCDLVDCTDPTHYHDCPADCTDPTHYHTCPVGCADPTHYHDCPLGCQVHDHGCGYMGGHHGGHHGRWHN